MTVPKKNEDEEEEIEIPINITDSTTDQFKTDFELKIDEAKEAETTEEMEYEIIAGYKQDKVNEDIESFIGIEKYSLQIAEIVAQQRSSLIVDFNDIFNYGHSMYDKLTENPKIFLKFFQEVLYELDNKNGWGYFSPDKFFAIRISNYVNNKDIAKIRVGLNNQFITFRGIVQRQSEIRPYVLKFYMRCPKCKLGRYTVYPEAECMRCDNNPRMIPIKDKHVYTDSVMIKVQELNEDLRGALPRAVDCVVVGDLVDDIKAGGKLTITGFVELREIKSAMSKFLKFFVLVNVNNVQPIATNDLKLELEETKITKEDEKEILEFKKKPQQERLDILQASYAPAIFGHFDVKLVLLLALIGAGRIIVEGVLIRDRIHVLLIGDPSISKTQLLKFGELITIGSWYASGSGTSATGLTAAAIKESDGTYALQPGYLIFANGSVLWFDEADKVKPDVLSHLHQSMEDGLVSLAKGGQIATLNANTTIVAAMNPKNSRYALDLPVKDNIDDEIPDSFLTRFGFIFIMLDKVDEKLDRKVSKHIDSIIIDRVVPNYGVDIMNTVQLRKYLEYVHIKDIDPDFTREARDKLEDYYIEKRNKSTPDTLAITARMKQDMLRSCRALARLLLDRTVDLFHVDIIIGLMDRMFETVLKDEDGNYNVQQIVGKTAGKLKGAKLLHDICYQMVVKEGTPINRIPKTKLLNILVEVYHNTEKKAAEMIENAIFEGILRTAGENRLEYLHNF